MKNIFKILILIVLCFNTHDIYDFMNSDVINLTEKNFGKIVNKNRQTGKLTLVHFYNNMEDSNVEFSPKMEAKASQYKGIFTFCAVNCSSNPKLCGKETQKIPNLKVYIPMPYPNKDFENLDLGKAIGLAGTYVVGKFKELKDDEYEVKLKLNELLPKVLLFTEKPGNPLVYRSLSAAFDSKLEFFIVRKDQQDIISNFKIKTYPTLLVLRPNDKKHNIYKGKFVYGEMFEFLNIFSEQFVPTEDNNKLENEKPWMLELIPEFFSKSAKEVCYSLEKTLCVLVYVNEKPEKEIIDHLKGLKKNYENNNDRGINFKFLYIDINKQGEWKSTFGVESVNNYIILNTGRRKRFVKGNNVKLLNKDLEKIQGGDAKFTPVKGNELPRLE